MVYILIKSSRNHKEWRIKGRNNYRISIENQLSQIFKDRVIEYADINFKMYILNLCNNNIKSMLLSGCEARS